MANQEQLEILKQGADFWNKWRIKNSPTKIDLSKADFSGSDLSGVDLRDANLREAYFSFADLSRARLYEANLNGAKISEANLSEADLTDANLTGATLRRTILNRAILTGADLREADLSGANLSKIEVSRVNLKDAIVADTIFGDIDLTKTYGLEELRHLSPSTIGSDTLQLFKGNNPTVFLRGCGLADWEIESAKLYNPALTNEEIVKIQYRIYDLRATQAIQISPLFISYSHADAPFVDKLDSALTERGIRFWRDIHDMKSGRMETQIDRAIRQNPTVLVIFSEHSLKSDWVEHEVRMARELEKELGRDALCPIALDDRWKDSPWPKRVMEQVMEYNILDFSAWRDHGNFENVFKKLVDGLDLFYK